MTMERNSKKEIIKEHLESNFYVLLSYMLLLSNMLMNIIYVLKH